MAPTLETGLLRCARWLDLQPWTGARVSQNEPNGSSLKLEGLWDCGIVISMAEDEVERYRYGWAHLDLQPLFCYQSTLKRWDCVLFLSCPEWNRMSRCGIICCPPPEVRVNFFTSGNGSWLSSVILCLLSVSFFESLDEAYCNPGGFKCSWRQMTVKPVLGHP